MTAVLLPARWNKGFNAMRAKGRLKKGEMNKSEAAYAALLEARRARGEIAWFRFEGIKLRLASGCSLTCDFAVMTADGGLELHDVKGGFFTEDARVKMKVAAEEYPLRIVAVTPRAKKHGGGWSEEEF